MSARGPLPAQGQAGCQRSSTRRCTWVVWPPPHWTGKHRLAQALLFFRVPAATERKRSPDAPGMTFPRNIKKVWSAGCGHQRLQRKQPGGSPKAAREPQCRGRGLGGQHLQPDWSRARVCVETKRRRALPPPPPGRLGTCSYGRKNHSPAHQQVAPPHKLAPPCRLCRRLRGQGGGSDPGRSQAAHLLLQPLLLLRKHALLSPGYPRALSCSHEGPLLVTRMAMCL